MSFEHRDSIVRDLLALAALISVLLSDSRPPNFLVLYLTDDAVKNGFLAIFSLVYKEYILVALNFFYKSK